MDERDRDAIEAYYRAMPRDGRWVGRCEMRLPEGLAGKRVLDLACRNGKGAFKLADRVGPAGFVCAVDSDEACIARAREAALCGAAGEGCGALEFRAACFERLTAAGVAQASFDVVYVNSAINLAYDLEGALQEAARVLVPGGRLWVAGIFADASLPNDRMRSAAEAGNAFGAARTESEFEALALHSGFATCSFSMRSPVKPDGLDYDGSSARQYHAACAEAAKSRLRQE